LDLREQFRIDLRQTWQGFQSRQQLLQAVVVHPTAQGECLRQGGLEGFGIARFGQVPMGAPHRLEARRLVHLPGQHDPDHVGMTLLHHVEQLLPVHSRHAQVGHQRVKGFALQQAEGLPAARHESHRPGLPLTTQHPLQALQHHGFVVYEENGTRIGLAHVTPSVYRGEG
jgi:hypothetical protein